MGPLQAQAMLAQRRSSRDEPKLGSSSNKSEQILKSDNLEDLLKEIGLEKYYPLFQMRGVELSQFAGLTDEDLKDLVSTNTLKHRFSTFFFFAPLWVVIFLFANQKVYKSLSNS